MPFLMTAYPTFDYFSTKRSLGVNLYITPYKKGDDIHVCTILSYRSFLDVLSYGCFITTQKLLIFWQDCK